MQQRILFWRLAHITYNQRVSSFVVRAASGDIDFAIEFINFEHVS